jgi:hypothetical protein
VTRIIPIARVSIGIQDGVNDMNGFSRWLSGQSKSEPSVDSDNMLSQLKILQQKTNLTFPSSYADFLMNYSTPMEFTLQGAHWTPAMLISPDDDICSVLDSNFTIGEREPVPFINAIRIYLEDLSDDVLKSGIKASDGQVFSNNRLRMAICIADSDGPDLLLLDMEHGSIYKFCPDSFSLERAADSIEDLLG